MKKIYFPIIILFLFVFANSFGQNLSDSLIHPHQNALKEIKGLVIDSLRKTPLSYANIYVLHTNKGMISNEQGQFSVLREGLHANDTLRFQYIGYATKKIPVSDLDSASVVYLKEEFTNLSEALVFGNAPNAEEIVKKVLLYKDSNYKRTSYNKEQTFIREKQNVDFTDIRLDCKKSSIPGLDKDMIQLLEDKIPKKTTSYTDFLGNIYFSPNKKDSIRQKLEEIRTVSLKEKDMTEFDQFETLFENTFKQTDEKEYWKVRSGIFASKIDEDNEQDTVQIKNTESLKDTLAESKKKLSAFNNGIKNELKYSLMDDKDDWEFLYKTGRYRFTLVGGTRVNGEDVYMIDFAPKNSGTYQGRLYISTSTFALIRADYEYAPGEMGLDFHLLGLGYMQTQFNGSIYFEKKKDGYQLKYFSYKAASRLSIERKMSLLKKRKRWLFDEKLEELKLDIHFAMNIQESVEYLVLEEKPISPKQFNSFKQAKEMNVIYVDQFDDQLWSGFPIIEPTKQMKEYKKQQVNY